MADNQEKGTRFRVPIQLRQYRTRKRDSSLSKQIDDEEIASSWVEVGPETVEQTWVRSRQQSLADLKARGANSSSKNTLAVDWSAKKLGGVQTARDDVNRHQESVSFAVHSQDPSGPQPANTQRRDVEEQDHVLVGSARVLKTNKAKSHSLKTSRRSRRVSTTSRSTSRRKKKDDERNLFPIEKFNKDEKDENKLDVVRNVAKLGVAREPIPFSYKGGQDGREKQRIEKDIWDDLDPRQPEGLFRYAMFTKRDDVSTLNVEQNSTRLLKTLHKRLGYLKPGNLEKITNSYETNKRKYLAAVEAADQRQRDIEDQKFSSGGKKKGKSLIAWRKHREKKR